MRRARSDDAAAARAALGTYVDYMVGDLYDIQIVLYDDSRISSKCNPVVGSSRM